MKKLYQGVFICEVGSKSKRLIGWRYNNKNKNNNKIYEFSDFRLVKIKTESFLEKDSIQQMLISLTGLQLEINTIYIHLRYERLDLMKLKLKNLIGFLHSYKPNICLIVSGSEYESSLDVEEDYKLIEQDLCQKYEIKDFCFSYCIHQKYNRRFTYFFFNNTTKSYNMHFLQSTIKYYSCIVLDAMQMNLYPIIDQDLMKQLQTISNPQQKQLQMKENHSVVNQEKQEQKNQQIISKQQFNFQDIKQQEIRFLVPQNQIMLYNQYNSPMPIVISEVRYITHNYYI